MKLPYPLRRTRVKICGLTRAQDAIDAVSFGADAIGLVFYRPSPRFIEIEKAQEVVKALPAFVTVVALFVDASPSEVQAVLDRVNIGLLQFHGDESPEYCESFQKPYIKAFRMRPDLDLDAAFKAYRGACGFLLDAWHPDEKGGTGERFDWARVPKNMTESLILAGGLLPENVAEAMETVRPFGLDVSSGVETQKGIKNAEKMSAFFHEVYQFDYRQFSE